MHGLDYNDIIGTRFGEIVVTEFAGKGNSNELRYKVKCDCGEIQEVSRNFIIHKKRKCGKCRVKEQKEFFDNYAEALVGQVIGDLTVLKVVGKRPAFYIVECKCGKKERVPKSQLNNRKRRCKTCNTTKNNKPFFRVIHRLIRNLNTEEEVV